MFPAAFILFILISFVFGLTSIVIAMHFSRFGVQGDKSKLFATLVLSGSAILFGMMLVTFLSVPWNNINQIFYDLFA